VVDEERVGRLGGGAQQRTGRRGEHRTGLQRRTGRGEDVQALVALRQQHDGTGRGGLLADPPHEGLARLLEVVDVLEDRVEGGEAFEVVAAAAQLALVGCGHPRRRDGGRPSHEHEHDDIDLRRVGELQPRDAGRERRPERPGGPLT
jgi:hypothetical protein